MTRTAKKEFKKMHRSLNLVARFLDVKRCSDATEWVIVWGAGLGVGTPKIALCHFLQPSPVEIRYYSKQPFCAARFETSFLATAAKAHRNGEPFLPMQPMYIDYIEKEPPPEDYFVLDSFLTPWPNGLTLLPDFITESEEKFMLQELFPHIDGDDILRDEKEDIDSVPVTKLIPPPTTHLRQRLVRHFGYKFRYESNDVDLDNPNAPDIPQYMVKTFSKMMSWNIIHRKPEQLTMNCYIPGQGIPPHVDTHSAFEQPILSLSLGSPVVMDFRHAGIICSVVLPQRSLLVMREDARYLWTHAIAARRYDVVEDPGATKMGIEVVPRGVRVSLTFRLLNFPGICNCRFPNMCDSQRGQLSAELAPELERDLVHKVYDEIAEHFSSTRHTPWPRVKDFLSKITNGQAVLDVGCGNGKYFNLTDYIYQVGMDMSKALLKIAKNHKGVDGVRANCLKIPFKDESFDAIICIAVLHHLSTKERRLQALGEIYRVLTPGGRALIYVWAQDQKLRDVKSAYARQKALKAGQDSEEMAMNCGPKDYSFLPIHVHEENFRFNDMLVPWMNESGVRHRFYHVFTSGELEGLIGEMDFSPPPRIIDSYYDQGNWCVEIGKDDDTSLIDPLLMPVYSAATLSYTNSVSSTGVL